MHLSLDFPKSLYVVVLFFVFSLYIYLKVFGIEPATP